MQGLEKTFNFSTTFLEKRVMHEMLQNASATVKHVCLARYEKRILCEQYLSGILLLTQANLKRSTAR